jgi:hypothetical protein
MMATTIPEVAGRVSSALLHKHRIKSSTVPHGNLDARRCRSFTGFQCLVLPDSAHSNLDLLPTLQEAKVKSLALVIFCSLAFSGTPENSKRLSSLYPGPIARIMFLSCRAGQASGFVLIEGRAIVEM